MGFQRFGQSTFDNPDIQPVFALALIKMAIYPSHMAISVTKFRNSCLDVIRRVETSGQAVAITRRGKVVARIAPPVAVAKTPVLKPWEQLRQLGGHLVAAPGESVADDRDFKALR